MFRCSLSVLRVRIAERDSVGGIVAPEEKPRREASQKTGLFTLLSSEVFGHTIFVSKDSALLPLVVGERDALRGHLEVNDGGGRRRSGSQGLGYGFGHCLGARQGLHVHRVDVENVARWRETVLNGSDVLEKTTPVHAERSD